MSPLSEPGLNPKSFYGILNKGSICYNQTVKRFINKMVNKHPKRQVEEKDSVKAKKKKKV